MGCSNIGISDERVERQGRGPSPSSPGLRVKVKMATCSNGFGWFLESGFGIRVSGFGFRVSGFGIRDSGFGIRDLGIRFRVSGAGAVLSDRVVEPVAGCELCAPCERPTTHD